MNDMERSEPTEALKQLQAKGWRMQFSASGERLKEMIEMYTSMGMEVHTIPVNAAICGQCTLCFDNEDQPTMMILTRKTVSGSGNAAP